MENNGKNLKFKVGGIVRKSKHTFTKGCTPARRRFCHQKVKNTVQWTCIIKGLNGLEIVKRFYEKEQQIANQTVQDRKSNNKM